MRLFPYPRYKAGPAKWLGDVPEHWAVERIKYSLSEKKARSAPALPAGAISYGRVIAKDGERLPEETLATYQEVLTGEYLINPINLNYDLISLRTALSSIDVVVSPAYIVARPDAAKLLPSFGSYLLYVFDIRHMKSLGAGVRQTIAFKDIGNCYWSLPSINEQAAISAFLDRETARIDSLIDKKGRFIGLLQEKRQALTARAVTKGLNRDAPTSFSGVKWLGNVPNDWTVKPLKYLCHVRTGKRDTAHAVPGGGYPFFVRSQTVEEIDSYSADCEAILTAGDGAGVGKVYHYYNGKFDFHQRVYMLSRFEGVMGRYLFHYLSALFAAVALDGGAKSTVDSLRMPVFMSFPVSFPNLEEQGRIVAFIDGQHRRIDDLINKTERSIELLKEHRSALITAAVTGKIDVRGLAAKKMKAAA